MKCPFCKNDIIEGATVCGHCGAFEKDTIAWWGQIISFIGIFAGAIISIFLIVEVSSTAGFIFIPVFYLVLFFFVHTIGKKKKWYHHI